MFQTFLHSPVVTATASLFSSLTSATHVSSVGVVRDSTVATAWVGHDSSCVAVSALSLLLSLSLIFSLSLSLLHSFSLIFSLSLSPLPSFSLIFSLSLLLILFLSYIHTFTQNTQHV